MINSFYQITWINQGRMGVCDEGNTNGDLGAGAAAIARPTGPNAQDLRVHGHPGEWRRRRRAVSPGRRCPLSINYYTSFYAC